MAVFTKVIGITILNMELDMKFINNQIITRENLKIINLKVMEHLLGKTVINMLVSGYKVKDMVKALLSQFLD